MDYIEIYAEHLEKIITKITKSTILRNHTISIYSYYLKEWTTILHYQHKKFTIFYYLYMSPLCIRKP